jgi:hypothetical protein
MCFICGSHIPGFGWSCFTRASFACFDLAERAIELSYQTESLYLRANLEQKRRLLKSLLSNCYLKDTTLYPAYKKPFDIIAEGIKTNNKRG